MLRRLESRTGSPLALLAGLLLLGAACGGPGQPPAEAPAAETPAAEDAQAAAPEQAPAPAPAKSPAASYSAPAPASPAPPSSRAEAAPAPTPAPPEPVIKTVPAGTVIAITFLDGLSSKTNVAGDTFQARVTDDVVIDGIPVIPAGSVVVGTVTEAVSLKKIGGRAKLALDFDRLELPSGRTALISAAFAQEGKSETKKDAATIGGAAAGGALLGRLIKKDDKDKGTLIGAVVGAAAGTAIAAKTEGEEVEIPVGVVLDIALNESTQVTVEP